MLFILDCKANKEPKVDNNACIVNPRNIVFYGVPLIIIPHIIFFYDIILRVSFFLIIV